MPYDPSTSTLLVNSDTEYLASLPPYGPTEIETIVFDHLCATAVGESYEVVDEAGQDVDTAEGGVMANKVIITDRALRTYCRVYDRYDKEDKQLDDEQDSRVFGTMTFGVAIADNVSRVSSLETIQLGSENCIGTGATLQEIGAVSELFERLTQRAQEVDPPIQVGTLECFGPWTISSQDRGSNRLRMTMSLDGFWRQYNDVELRKGLKDIPTANATIHPPELFLDGADEAQCTLVKSYLVDEAEAQEGSEEGRRYIDVRPYCPVVPVESVAGQ